MGTKHFLKGAAIGALLASVATILLAPKSGKRVQKDVKKLVETLTKQMGDVSLLTRDTYRDMAGRVIKEYAKGKKFTKEYVKQMSDLLSDTWADVSREIKKK